MSENLCLQCNQRFDGDGELCNSCKVVNDKKLQEKIRLLSTVEVLAALRDGKQTQ